jgi:hypothetical protein
VKQDQPPPHHLHERLAVELAQLCDEETDAAARASAASRAAEDAEASAMEAMDNDDSDKADQLMDLAVSVKIPKREQQ